MQRESLSKTFYGLGIVQFVQFPLFFIGVRGYNISMFKNMLILYPRTSSEWNPAVELYKIYYQIR